MRILSQDRRAIVELPGEVWVTQVGEEHNGLIVADVEFMPYLGIYTDCKRASEVLTEIFEAYTKKERVFIMPEG